MREPRFLPVAACALVAIPALAQELDEPRPWGPEQAIGPPDTPAAGDRETAWASKTEDGSEEWLSLEFPETVVPTAVRVVETFNPGAVVAVRLVDAEGDEHEVWRGSDPTPEGAERGISLIPIATEVAASRVTLVLDSPGVGGWNEIDAVGLHDRAGRLAWAVSATASSTYASGSPEAEYRVTASDRFDLDELGDGVRSAADGLYRVWLDNRDTITDDAARAAIRDEIVALQRRVAVPSGGDTFAGLWRTTFGPLRLDVVDGHASGVYLFGGTMSEIEGDVEGRRLEFEYREPRAGGRPVRGEGWFELATDGRSFAGQWRAEGAEAWSKWTGERTPEGKSDKVWLVILESPWETDIAQQEFSFGGMLRAIFEHSPRVRVRQRFFTDAKSFELWCRELAFLAEPVYLVVASHASRSGVHSHGGEIAPDVIAAALRPVRNLRLVHFSACETMAGDMPDAILGERMAGDALEGVSGYDISVDWMGSALTEFLYLELLLNRRLEPAKAAKELVRTLDFADGEVHEGSAIPASHFRFRARKGPGEE